MPQLVIDAHFQRRCSAGGIRSRNIGQRRLFERELLEHGASVPCAEHVLHGFAVRASRNVGIQGEAVDFVGIGKRWVERERRLTNRAHRRDLADRLIGKTVETGCREPLPNLKTFKICLRSHLHGAARNDFFWLPDGCLLFALRKHCGRAQLESAEMEAGIQSQSRHGRGNCKIAPRFRNGAQDPVQRDIARSLQHDPAVLNYLRVRGIEINQPVCNGLDSEQITWPIRAPF